MQTMWANASNNTPSYTTPVSLYVESHEESTPWVRRSNISLDLGLLNLELAIPSLIQSTWASLGIGSGILSSTSPPRLLVMVVVTLATHFKATIAIVYGPHVAALSTGLPQRARDSCRLRKLIHCGGENKVNHSIVYKLTFLKDNLIPKIVSQISNQSSGIQLEWLDPQLYKGTRVGAPITDHLRGFAPNL